MKEMTKLTDDVWVDPALVVSVTVEDNHRDYAFLVVALHAGGSKTIVERMHYPSKRWPDDGSAMDVSAFNEQSYAQGRQRARDRADDYARHIEMFHPR